MEVTVAVIGTKSVGKTSLGLRFVTEKWEPLLVKATIQIEFLKPKNLSVDGQDVKFLFIDTAGTETFDALGARTFRRADGWLVMYDITRRKTFEAIPAWLQKIKDMDIGEFEYVLVGNKVDMEQKREVTYEEGLAFAESKGWKFFETSAQDNVNVTRPFMAICSQILKCERFKQKNEVVPIIPPMKISDSEKVPEKKKKDCC